MYKRFALTLRSGGLSFGEADCTLSTGMAEAFLAGLLQ